jgi:hypothetical protein
MSSGVQSKSQIAVESSLIRKDEEGLSQFSAVRYCNHCGHSMRDPRSFIVEYWRAEQTVYFCWCYSCGHRWELAEVTKITMLELDDGGEDL